MSNLTLTLTLNPNPSTDVMDKHGNWMWDRRLQVCQMPTIGQNACVQTFAKVVDSFVDRYLWQVITDMLFL